MLIDGHAPGLSGKALQTYIGSGISSDHECTTLDEGLEKLRSGMAVFIREGSTAHNLEALLPIINSPASRHCLLVTDDRHADDLINQGHLDHILRRAVALGADPVTALQMVTINAARHFGLRHTGAIVPGYRADLVVVDNLKQFKVSRVLSKGVCVARDGAMTTTLPVQSRAAMDDTIQSSVKIDSQVVDLSIPAGSGEIKVIGCSGDQIVTRRLLLEPAVEAGMLVSDVERDIIKIAVIERHHGSHRIGLGFVQGLGLQQGAIGSTVAHDSHNLVVAGTSDAAMLQAVEKITAMQGGLAVTGDDCVHAALPLPVAGLMSTDPAAEVSAALAQLHNALSLIGTAVENPFMLLSFMALPVIPELKITDKGLVDVAQFCLVPLQEEKKS
jgi:adenine deaminase